MKPTSINMKDTKMIIHNLEQGTEDWFKVRLGKVTASNFGDVMAKGTGKTRQNYMIKLAAEIITGLPEESYTNSSMQWGIEHEAEARAYYESLYGWPVEQVGFVEMNEFVGCSPDGLVGESGLIEIKCPKSSTHIANILDNKMQTCYTAQVQGQLWVTERQWCDWISFDPRVTSNPFFRVRVERDDKYIAVLEEEVKQFVKELQAMIKRLAKVEF